MMVLLGLFFFLLGDLGFLFFLLIVCMYFMQNMFSGFCYGMFFNFDYISVGLCFLTILVFLFVYFMSFLNFSLKFMWGQGFFLYLALMFLLIMFFFVGSFMVFFIVFEFCVLPVFLLIIGWGYSYSRFQSSMYMIIFTLFSSFPLLFYLVISNSVVSYFFMLHVYFSSKMYFSYWWSFIIFVFLVKLPLYIFHFWLPKAHVEAPVSGSVVLAGVLLKLGGYGLYSVFIFFYMVFMGPLFFMPIFSVWGSFLMSLMCIRQVDSKMLIAYSSIVHMGTMVASLFLLIFSSFLGSFWAMISHGVCSSSLFFMANCFYLFSSSRSVFLIRGLIFVVPILILFWFFYCMINMSFPPSFSFFSELYLLVGVFSVSSIFMILMFLIMLMTGLYCVFMYLIYSHGLNKLIFVKVGLFFMMDLLFLFFSMLILFFFMLFMFLL